MKRILCILLTIGLLATQLFATGGETLKHEDLVKANQIGNILKDHSNITMSQLVLTNGDVCYQCFFKDEQGRYIATSFWQKYQYYSCEDFSLELYNDELNATVVLSKDKYYEIEESSFTNEFDENTVYSTDELGNLVVTTSLLMDEEMASSYGFVAGDELLSSITISPKDNIVKKFNWDIKEKLTGNEFEYATAVINLDLEVIYPITLKSLMDGESYNLKIVYEDASTKEFKIPKGVTVNYDLEEGSALYDNRNFPILHKSQESEVLTKDTTLFYNTLK